VLSLLLCGLSLVARPAAAAPITLNVPAITLSVLPSLQTASVGDGFSLDVAIANVTDLFDYQFDLTFDKTILRADSVLDGGFLTSGGGTSVFGGPFVLTLDNTTGLVTVLDSLLGPAPPATGVTGDGVLAAIMFTALATGTSDIGLANVILEDSFGNRLDAQLSGGQVNVNGPAPAPVPEPSTILLMASGLIAGCWRIWARNM